MEKPPLDTEFGEARSECALRRKQRHQLLIGMLLDYAKNTTLHGLRYITEKGLTIIEKVFWIITFVISLSLCLFLIRNVWIKWKSSPVIVSLSEHLVSVGEVPFPAVTICPQTKVYPNHYNYSAAAEELFKTESYLNFTMNETFLMNYETLLKENHTIQTLVDVDMVCFAGSFSWGLPFDNIPKLSDHTMVYNIIKASPQVINIFFQCKWRNQYIDCADLFDPVVTEEGVCFTFNTLAADEIFHLDSIQKAYAYLNSSTPRKGWSLEHGYSVNEQDTYPRRGQSNGAMPDLVITFLEFESHQDPICNRMREGYKVFLQHPADLPQSSLYYYAALPGQVSSFGIKFSILNTSDTLTSYSPYIRQCYFPGELQLKYFRVYTPSNCRLECLSDYTFQRCGCVWFHMPHNSSTAICTYMSENCVASAIDDYATKESLGTIKDSRCHCLPSCTHIQYDAEILKSAYDMDKFLKALYNIKGKPEKNGSSSNAKDTRIEMYFKEARFVSMRRSELFGLTDFLANCGGLLGLFLGFSFLSLVEIFYFCTLRLGCLLRKDTLRKKKN